MANHLSTRAYLENLPLFRELTPLQVDRISRHTRPVRTARGDTVVHRGDEANGFHVIICGQIKLAFVSAGGHEKVIDVLGPGGSFGQPAMFMRQPHLVVARALADSLLLHVERDAVFDEIKRDRDFAAKIIADLAHRLHELMDGVFPPRNRFTRSAADPEESDPKLPRMFQNSKQSVNLIGVSVQYTSW